MCQTGVGCIQEMVFIQVSVLLYLSSYIVLFMLLGLLEVIFLWDLRGASVIVTCLQLRQCCTSKFCHSCVLSSNSNNILNPFWQRPVIRCREEEANPPMIHTKSEPPKQGCTAANIHWKNLGKKRGNIFVYKGKGLKLIVNCFKSRFSVVNQSGCAVHSLKSCENCEFLHVSSSWFGGRTSISPQELRRQSSKVHRFPPSWASWRKAEKPRHLVEVIPVQKSKHHNEKISFLKQIYIEHRLFICD